MEREENKGGGWEEREESGFGLKHSTRGEGKSYFCVPFPQEQRTVS